MDYPAALALAVGLGLPIAVLLASTAQGRAAAAAVESIARQPEAAGDIRSALLLALALIESLVIYCLLIFFLLMGKLPGILEYLDKAR
ncbi:MAG: ATP synthase F0 subunit C [Deltaproteobacteria bacterium]|nr:ATP synthase F0 subunit C [Armatimonadota bacterium]MBM4321146.1 ATP synthase F0 subunit C [Deltaproteobacteria bacterium]